MSTEMLLNVDPQELSFPIELKKRVSCSIRLSNNTQKFVAFKVKTTTPDKYIVQPNIGIVLPGSTLDLLVTMQALKVSPPNMECKDKFLIQSVVSSAGATTDVQNLFNKENGHLVQECKLTVVYISVPKVTPSVADDESMRGRKLLDVQPLELQFPFILNKVLFCSLQLSNMNENRVAFKIKTTNPKMYCVQPNIGVVLPRSTCTITVKMQAQKTAPSMQCKDKFLIQSALVSPAAIPKDITRDMFNNAEECKLGVVYDFSPRPSSSNAVTPEGGSSQNVSTLEERNSNGPEVLPDHDGNRHHIGELLLRWIISGLLGLILFYLLKIMLPLVWSMTFLVTMLALKMIKKLVSDSLEDWVVKTLLYIVIHVLFRRNQQNGNGSQ